MSKLVLKVEDLENFFAFKKLINSLDLSDIILTKNNEEFILLPEEIEEWKFMGLTNLDFFNIQLDIGND